VHGSSLRRRSCFRALVFNVITEIRQKIFTTLSNSKSLKVSGTDTDRSATYDLLLVFHAVDFHVLTVLINIPPLLGLMKQLSTATM